MERKFLAAKDAHIQAKMRRPAAAGESDSAGGGGQARRVRRRLRGKQPMAKECRIPNALIMEKVMSSKNMASFQSWGYHRVRAALVRAGVADTDAKAQGAVWHRRLKDVWVAHHGGAA